MSARIAPTRPIVLLGLEGYGVDVEVRVGRDLVTFTLVGLSDVSLREAKDRVRPVFQAIECEVLDAYIMVNLSLTGLLRSGSGFDPAIAAAILEAAEAIHPQAFVDTILLVELGLDGRLRPIESILSAVAAAKQIGAKRIIVAAVSAVKASLVADIEVLGFDHLADVVVWAGGRASKPQLFDPVPMRSQSSITYQQAPDLADARGQDIAIDALEVAAAGGHHLFLIGESGAGKMMLASRLPSILPPLEEVVALQTTVIHSFAGILPQDPSLIRIPPLRAPCHPMMVLVLIGGGSGIAVPGTMPLAHGGVPFPDEAAEFSSSVLDSLRQPLEERFVTIHRSKASARYPLAFQLIFASNPCPCGHGGRACHCTPVQRGRYASRFSGPLPDRIDITITMRQPTKADFRFSRQRFSVEVRKRAEEARARGARRLKDTGWKMNSEFLGVQIRHSSGTPGRLIEALDRAVDGGTITMRGADRALRLMWTLADPHERPLPNDEDLARALMLRNGGLNAN